MTRHALARRWPGATMACLATGPSLTAEDCAMVRGKARVIAINDAYRLAPWADILFSADRRWWPHHQGVPSFHGMKVGIGSAPGLANPFPQYPEITVLANVGYAGLSDDPGGVTNGSNSGFSALGLAVLLGASRILLLGYDMSYDQGRAHFFGDHPSGLRQTESLYPSFRRAFESLVDPLKARGVEVLNCTRRTALTAFPRMALEEALEAVEVPA